MNQKGNVLLTVMLVSALGLGAFFYITKRNINLQKNIDDTIHKYELEARLFELRSVLTHVGICESSLSNKILGQTSEFTLRNGSQQINLNSGRSEIKLKSLRLTPLDPVNNEFANGNIQATFEIIGKTKSERTFIIPFNFMVDPTSRRILECLGERSDESDELFRSTIAKRRADICRDALKGTVKNGKCEWPW